MKSITRELYLNQLSTWKDKHIIKIITGIRRSGKSTLMQLFQERLLREGVKKNQIISLNLEDLAYEPLQDYRELYKHIEQRLRKGVMNYVFIDEIQAVPLFQKAIDSLYIKENVDLYLTGSNAHLLSGEISTLLSGRYIEVEVLPFSLYEYGLAFDMPAEQLYRQYISTSSFPYTLNLSGDIELRQYLQGVYNTVILKDVIQRTRIQEPNMLERIIRYLSDNIGSLTSLKAIADTLTSAGSKVSQQTVDSYVSALLNSYMFYQVSRYDIHGRENLRVGSKYYIADIGLRNMQLGIRPNDFGHILENVVYLELRRRGWQIFVGRIGQQEIDFVCQQGGATEYYQVALTVREEGTLQRELAPLKSVRDNYSKYLLTLDNDPVSSYGGIQKRYVLDWLLGK